MSIFTRAKFEGFKGRYDDNAQEDPEKATSDMLMHHMARSKAANALNMKNSRYTGGYKYSPVAMQYSFVKHDIEHPQAAGITRSAGNVSEAMYDSNFHGMGDMNLHRTKNVNAPKHKILDSRTVGNMWD